MRIEIEEALAAPSVGQTTDCPNDESGWRQALVLGLAVPGCWPSSLALAVWNLKPVASSTAGSRACDNAAAGPTIGRSG